MEELLVKLMKLEPSERMTFTEFFDFVDDLVKSKLTVISVQDGSVCKVEFDKNIRYDQWGQGDYQAIKEIKEGFGGYYR